MSWLSSTAVKSYRPISNLPVLSKLLERLVARQLRDYLNRKKLLPHLQTAYRAYHSTETAVVKVLMDILRALDAFDLTMLTLLDLSAAFDRVDHATLLRRLEITYGIRSTSLGWFSSYLGSRFQYVRCGLSKSTLRMVLCGVPWRSTTGFGPWTGTLLTVHSGYHQADWESLSQSTRLRRRSHTERTYMYRIKNSYILAYT